MLTSLAFFFHLAAPILGLPSRSCAGDAKYSAMLSQSSIWQPAVGSSWQIVLQSAVELDTVNAPMDPDVSVIDLDLFTNTYDGRDGRKVEALHGLGKKVICYFSAGSYEPFRPDADDFQPADLGRELDGWPGERWLRVGSDNVRRIMANRVAMAGRMGCDAIDPDNVDGYGNDNGLGLTQADAVSYVRFLADEAAKHGMAIGLKNAGEIVPQVLPLVHFSINEQCASAAMRECGSFMPFIAAGKPVFHIEYTDRRLSAGALARLCETVDEDEGPQDIRPMSTVVKNLSLDGWMQLCDGRTAVTRTESTAANAD